MVGKGNDIRVICVVASVATGVSASRGPGLGWPRVASSVVLRGRSCINAAL